MVGLVDELFDAGLLAERGAEAAGDWLFVVRVWRLGACGIQLIENQQIAVGIVHRREFGDSFERVLKVHGVHLVVFELIPGDVPARIV